MVDEVSPGFLSLSGCGLRRRLNFLHCVAALLLGDSLSLFISACAVCMACFASCGAPPPPMDGVSDDVSDALSSVGKFFSSFMRYRLLI